jgi:hypothetical protein
MSVTIYAEEKKHWWSFPRTITLSEEEFNVRKKTRGGYVMPDEFSTRARPVRVAQGNFLSEFMDKMKSRLDMGERKYSDKSFLTDNLFTDIKEELLDFANYSYLLYERIRRLEMGEKASDYLHFCRAVDLTDDPIGGELKDLFAMYKVCHRYNGREYHYCQKGDVDE